MSLIRKFPTFGYVKTVLLLGVFALFFQTTAFSQDQACYYVLDTELNISNVDRTIQSIYEKYIGEKLEKNNAIILDNDECIFFFTVVENNNFIQSTVFNKDFSAFADVSKTEDNALEQVIAKNWFSYADDRQKIELCKDYPEVDDCEPVNKARIEEEQRKLRELENKRRLAQSVPPSKSFFRLGIGAGYMNILREDITRSDEIGNYLTDSEIGDFDDIYEFDLFLEIFPASFVGYGFLFSNSRTTRQIKYAAEGAIKDVRQEFVLNTLFLNANLESQIAENFIIGFQFGLGYLNLQTIFSNSIEPLEINNLKFEEEYTVEGYGFHATPYIDIIHKSGPGIRLSFTYMDSSMSEKANPFQSDNKYRPVLDSYIFRIFIRNSY